MVRYPRIHVALLVLAFIGSWIVGYWIQVTYLNSPWMVGGSVCKTTVVDGQEMLGCFGYPPVGVVFIGIAAMMAMSGVYRQLERLISTLPPG